MDIRYDTAAAAAALAALIPDDQQRRDAAESLAASIRFVHRQAPNAWELTGWKDLVRLNVGQIAVFDVLATHIRMYSLKGPSLRSQGYQLTGHGNYRAIEAPSECWRIPLDRVGSLAKPLIERHRALLTQAGQAKRVSPFRRAHSPGFVTALANLIRGTLPQPEYSLAQTDRVEPPSDIEVAGGALFGSPESNRKVEKAAVDSATAHLTARGWDVRSVERDRCGYDLHCRRGRKELHVEVKGVSGVADRFIITAGEVTCAETDPDFMLILVGEALSAAPTLESWSGQELLRSFELSPVQFYARRRASSSNAE